VRNATPADGVALCSARLEETDHVYPWWEGDSVSPDLEAGLQSWREWWQEIHRVTRLGSCLPVTVEDQDGRVVGLCLLWRIDQGTASAELRFWLSSTAREHEVDGIVLRAVVEQALRTLRVKRVSCPVYPGDTSALHTVQASGMSFEATMASFQVVEGSRRDHQLWASVARSA
jgi:ribosomal-protein-alanine N-acetyltransferase